MRWFLAGYLPKAARVQGTSLQRELPRCQSRYRSFRWRQRLSLRLLPCSIATVGVSPKFGVLGRQSYQEIIWLQHKGHSSPRNMYSGNAAQPTERLGPRDKTTTLKLLPIARNFHTVENNKLAWPLLLCCIESILHATPDFAYQVMSPMSSFEKGKSPFSAGQEVR